MQMRMKDKFGEYIDTLKDGYQDMKDDAVEMASK